MLSTSTLLFTSLLAGFAAAQNSSSTSNFNANSVDLTTRNQWCSGETANCPMLCGGPSATKQNSCSGQTLVYQCICSNGSAPASIDQYLDTLPNHICQATFAQCRQQNPGSDACTTCGTLMASSVPSATSSMSSAAATSGSMTSSSSAPAATGAKKGDAPSMKVQGGNAVGMTFLGLLGALVF